MMVVMFAIIYFLMIRPEQKKQKSRQQMINNVKKGDKIVTIGGIYGTVGNVKDGVIMIKIAENTVVELRKGAISEVIADEKSVAEKEKEKEKKR
jgi:preprotein translocase subunit YajC